MLLVVLNGDDHLRELRDLMVVALADLGPVNPPPAPFERIGLDQGQILLSKVFPTVARYDFVSSLLLPGSEPVAEYVRSTFLAQSLPEPQQLAAAVASRLGNNAGSTVRVRTHSGCLVCE